MENYSEEEYYIAGQMNDLYDFISQQDSGYTDNEINEALGNMSDEDIERFHAFIFNNANKALKNKILETLAETNTLVKNTIILQSKEKKEKREALINTLIELILEKNGLLLLIFGITGEHQSESSMKKNLNNISDPDLKSMINIAKSL